MGKSFSEMMKEKRGQVKFQKCKKEEISTGSNFLSILLNTIDVSVKEEAAEPLVQRSKRHRSPNFKSQIFLNKVRWYFSDVISAFQISRATLSKISDKVENA